MSITIESTAFAPNERIPTQYTADGQDLSPPLSWSGIPDSAKELALIMDDPDAPTAQPFVHWLLYKIPANAMQLAEGVPKQEQLDEPQGALQGRNSFGSIGYGGPAPPKGHGTHHYHFKVYALDAALDLRAAMTKDDLLKAMEGHILAQGELVGTYDR